MNMETDGVFVEKFFKFTDEYNSGKFKIELKRIHTLAVANLMSRLSQMMGLSERFRQVAFVCGIVHDIGRFDQLKIFDSYSDKDTLDHGDLGYRILRETDFLDSFNDEEKEMICQAVKYHNKLAIDGSISGNVLLMCQLIRDADKIDNFRVNIEELSDEKRRRGLSDCILSKELFDCMCEHRMTPFELQHNDLDAYVGSLSYFFDMHFKESFVLALQQGYFGKLCTYFQPSDKESIRLVKQIISDVEEFVNERAAKG